jgi:succinate dehydrogenase/fumarate reductase flavoprotein subunit/uncharacterized protein with FMN-binding domain
MKRTQRNQDISRRDFLIGAAAAGAAASGAVLGIAGCSPQGTSADAKKEATGETRVVTGSGRGRVGEIIVKVALTGNTITSINILQQQESEVIANTALTRIPELVCKNQSLDVDVVSGATITSFGIKAAIEDALSRAGLSGQDLARAGTAKGYFIEEPIEADIAIIGGGLAGLTCAVRLLQSGNKVVIFEETAHVGGSAACAHGWITGAGTIMQKAQGIEDSSEQFFHYMNSLAESHKGIVAFPDVARAYAEKTGEVVDWLDTYVNVDFGDRTVYPGAYDAPDINRVYWANGGSHHLVLPLVEIIQQGIKEGNASLVLEARATKLNTDGLGAISGVEIRHADGTVKNFAYDAVIMCTGGYGYNIEMLNNYNYEESCTSNPSTSLGHGFALVEEVGAQLVLMDEAATYGNGIKNAGDEVRYLINHGILGKIWVTSDGVRLVNEDLWINEDTLWNEAPGNIGYVLFSEAQRFGTLRPIVHSTFHKVELTPWQSWELFDSLVQEGKNVFAADTVEELAQKAGIDPIGLAKTIETYNGYCEMGTDLDFNRQELLKFEGKLYAIKGYPYQLMTLGGVKISPNAEVVDANDMPIPGLYAAGEFLGIRQYAGWVRSGCGLGGAATWGYIAADVVSSRK